ncbi:hypothetical protein BOV90_10425 [Solemya velum gill symbiont]|uniref:hypothetical protein n=1 Tax=Solemya velum gill symbiont TaxID=2340 RepID=UPI000997754A|nr:hypothetical protein [Solemya velum gill symbiont]OOY37350.1 hypothetical protein BOV89_08160 [Solemya velum gill symbiont]OOY39240.1 hypothetical protein BOV90_10425 [Solemya velum gill symbiont]OOY44247.1 hypothetical protein BOV92_09155 [Solemya velum gill symbiont]
MFGFGKKKIETIWNDVAIKLREITAFQRYANDGKFPNEFKDSNYVLGYHFMMALQLYIAMMNGKTNPEEQGFVLINSLSLALEVDSDIIINRVMPLIENPDAEFSEGAQDAMEAIEMLNANNDLAFAKFNNRVREIA